MERKNREGKKGEEGDMEKEGRDMIERELERFKKKEERGWKEMKVNFTSTAMPQLYWLITL